MRILQIVTYISPDGAYGGPVRVAINQAKELTKLGHDVVVAAAAGNFAGAFPAEYDGYPVHLFSARRLVPRSGFAGLTSPSMLRWLTKAIHGADVIHVHLARDLVTLPAAVLVLLAGKPLVAQTHGMIDGTDKALAAPLDKYLTRPVLRAARTVFYLTERESQDLTEVAGQHLKLRHLPNGVDMSEGDSLEIVASKKTNVEVLYLARMHGRKRPAIFVDAAITLLRSGVSASFKLVGPDEGEVRSILRKIDDSGFREYINYEGGLEPGETLRRMMKCDVYVLPSINEPFPMSVIEAMAAGKPVVITESCGLSNQVASGGSGIVIDHTELALTESIRMLVENEALRLQMGSAAKVLVQQAYDMGRIARLLQDAYKSAINIRHEQTNRSGDAG